MSDERPFWQDGRVFVIGFLGFCFAVALGSVLLTLYGHELAPEEPPPPPPEVGHELVPGH